MLMNVGPVILPNFNTKGTSKSVLVHNHRLPQLHVYNELPKWCIQSVFSPAYIRHVRPTSLHYRISFDVGIGRIHKLWCGHGLCSNHALLLCLEFCLGRTLTLYIVYLLFFSNFNSLLSWLKHLFCNVLRVYLLPGWSLYHLPAVLRPISIELLSIIITFTRALRLLFTVVRESRERVREGGRGGRQWERERVGVEKREKERERGREASMHVCIQICEHVCTCM